MCAIQRPVQSSDLRITMLVAGLAVAREKIVAEQPAFLFQNEIEINISSSRGGRVEVVIMNKECQDICKKSKRVLQD